MKKPDLTNTDATYVQMAGLPFICENIKHNGGILMARWDPWTGCYGKSEGCRYCYYYGEFSRRRGEPVHKTDEFNKPVEEIYMPRKKITKYKIESGTVATCFTTDFFLPEADEWRPEAWSMIKKRPDLEFLILTKRIDNFLTGLPDDWNSGYSNVFIGCTVENSETARQRLPLFASLPIKRRFISCSPLLEAVELSPYLEGIEHVTVQGESGREARPCDLGWVLDIKNQCDEAGISFWFKSTGSSFIENGIPCRVPPKMQHSKARGYGLNSD